MKLEPGERSILASFAAGPNAEAAVAALKGSGFPIAQMDRIGRFGYSPRVDRKRPAITANETSQANATLDPAQLDDDSRILMAAFPENSGMSGEMTMDQMPFLVTVVTRAELVDQAVAIITEHGGRV
ncbi:MAG TPA: hypothetical protein VGK74_24805 [Symbiobacteriaceae bacterium]